MSSRAREDAGVAVRSPSTARTAPDSLVLARTVARAAFTQTRTSSHKQGRANPMMVTTLLPTTIHVGLDVAKLTLQVDLQGKSQLALPNTSAGHRSLLTHLRRLQAKTGLPGHVVCEGTGGYERAVVACSARRGSRCQRAQRRPGACVRPRPGPSRQDRRARCGRLERLRSSHAAGRPTNRPARARRPWPPW